MDAFARRTDRISSIGLGLVALGIAALVVQTWTHYMSAPGGAAFDGYWLRVEPWASIGLALVLTGASAATLAGAGLVLARGDWLRRLVVLLLLALPALWWAIALGLVSYPGFPPDDPLTLAHGRPLQAILLLLLPTVAINVLGVTPVRREPAVRFSRVHPESRPAIDRRAARREALDLE